jgi:hypothetical protein
MYLYLIYTTSHLLILLLSFLLFVFIFLQLPRYLIFDRTRQIKPFYTEFCVFQSTKAKEENGVSADGSGSLNNDEEMPALPELLCSKISRLYSADGQLQQGCTSFFTLQRFGATDAEESE